MYNRINTNINNRGNLGAYSALKGLETGKKTVFQFESNRFTTINRIK